jgi:hypothetical protein
LAAKFPDLSEDILSDSPDQRELFRSTVVNLMDFDESDLIPTYTLLHPPTPAMPQGRYTECLDNGTVLMDGPLPYEESHTYRIAPDEEDGTIFGYTVAFDLLPLQELLGSQSPWSCYRLLRKYSTTSIKLNTPWKSFQA